MRTLVAEGTGPLARAVVALLKDEGRKLVRTSSVPRSIVRASGFYWLLDRMLTNMAKRRVLRLPADIWMQRAFMSALEPASTSAAGRRGTTMWAEWLQRSGAALPLSGAA